MRLLLDENLPKRLKLDFAEHEVLLCGINNGTELRMEN